MAALSTLKVALGARSYPIEIGQGLLSGYDLAAAVRGPQALIVSNETVAPLYLDRVANTLLDRDVSRLILPDGERFKTLDSVSRVLDALADAGAGRDSTVIALGGGVVGDIAGFGAACYMRGIAVIQVPTTLLAQVDSSVGGKTGVNHARGKNLIGAFHQPSLVLIDIDTLSTLPDRELIAGLAEVIKHGAIADGEFFAWLEQHIDALRARDPGALTHAIRRCCEIKAAVVAEDERERGKRALLNFGHTFGHAIENSLGYGEWLHGEAVAAGMVMAAALSDLPDEDRQRLRELIERAGLPVSPPDIAPDRLQAAMGMDKKAEGSRLRFILLRRLGEAYVESNVSGEKLQRVLSSSAS